MEQDGIRKKEILNLLQSYAEQTFQTSCEFLQEKIEYNGVEIWAELKACIHKLLLQTGEAQAGRGKEQIQYLAFSFLRHSIYFSKLEYRIKGCARKGIVGSLDFVESMLRRGGRGIKLEELEVRK